MESLQIGAQSDINMAELDMSPRAWFDHLQAPLEDRNRSIH